MSKLVNQSRLQQFATKLWDKIKDRYDDAFINAEIPTAEKKIKFTKAGGGATKDVSLEDYARLQDRNEFKKDVSVDDAKIVSNKNIGELNGPVTAARRTTGYRGLTSRSFTDGYVKLLRVHLPQDARGNVNAHVWVVKKGASKTEDKYVRKIFKAVPVQTAGTNKYIDVDIDSTFTDETFFVLRTEGAQIRGIHNIKQEFINDVINVNDSFNPQSTTENINWNSFSPNTDLVGYMELHGRTGIVDISKRLDEIDTASGNYVKHSECTVQGGNASDNGKVVKLGTDGKLHESLMPSIAINEYIEVATFDHATLRNQRYENGDVVVVTSGGQVVKRYLCINKLKNPDNLTEGFVELNAKDGVVTSVEGKTGAVTLNIALEENKFKLKINGTGGTETVKEIEMISEQDITDILSRLN